MARASYCSQTCRSTPSAPPDGRCWRPIRPCRGSPLGAMSRSSGRLAPVPFVDRPSGSAGSTCSACACCAAAATAGRWAGRFASWSSGWGSFYVATVVRAGGVRHHAAERAHGPAHGAVDAGAAGARARRAGDPRAAHAAAAAAALAARRACTRGSRRCCRSRRSRSCCSSSRRGCSTSPAGTTRRCDSAYVHEMMHVHLVLVGSLFFWPLVGRRPGAGPGGLPVPDAAGRADAAVPRVPRRHDHGPDHAASAGTAYPALHDGPMGAWLPDPPTTSTSPAGSCGAPATWSALVFFVVLFAQWVRSSMREAAREDRRLDLLEARRTCGGATRRGPDRVASRP